MTRAGIQKFGFWESIVVSIAVTPVALFLGLVSTGAGHGDYFLAKLLFPYSMLSTVAFGEINLIFLVISLVQFPIYGLILAVGVQANMAKTIALATVAIHLFAVFMSFVLFSANFS